MKRFSVPEMALILGFVTLAAVMACKVYQSIIGDVPVERVYYDSPGARVITASPLELGLTYEDVGEKPPVPPPAE